MPRENALHLFSGQIPFGRWTRSWLATQKTEGEDPLLEELQAWPDVAVARERLRALTGSPPIGERLQGTVRLGRLEDSELANPEHMLVRARQLAACYVDMELFTPPYFDLPRSS